MRRFLCSPAPVLLATIAASHSLLGQNADLPSVTACTALDRAFVSAYHLYALLSIAASFALSFLLLPRLSLNSWWITRPIARLLFCSGSLLCFAFALLALPLVETVYSLSIGGFSVLSLYQVTDAYLDCETVAYVRQAFLWGDFFHAASKPAIYLGLYQLITFLIVTVLAGSGTYAIHMFRVKRYTLRGAL